MKPMKLLQTQIGKMNLTAWIAIPALAGMVTLGVATVEIGALFGILNNKQAESGWQ